MVGKRAKGKVFALARKTRIGSKLVDRGVITKRQVKETVRLAKKTSKDILAEREFKPLKSYHFTRTPGTVVVVVLHLYYLDAWDSLLLRLKRLKAFDLVVTMPKKNLHFVAEIKKHFPGAHIITVPNRGRDVLGFVGLLPALSQAGYKSVLKVHSKKSTHRTDGGEWLNDMLDKLMPEGSVLLNNMYETLERPKTAIIGPEGHYVSLRVNLDPNKHYLLKSLTAYYGKRKAKHILDTKNSYGFFAGTMFWARLDKLKTITKQKYRPRHFDLEAGQIDSTLAHALERLFCLVPEVEKNEIYASNGTTLKKIAYKTSFVPDWSDVYIEPKG